METDNIISFQISDDELSRVNKAIDELEEILIDKLISLKAIDRLSILKMGAQKTQFVNNCLQYMKQNPELTPQFVDVEEMEVDINAYRTLELINGRIRKIYSLIDDSKMLSGSEAYSSALCFYNNIKVAVKANVSGAKPIHENLRKQFPRKKRKNKEEE